MANPYGSDFYAGRRNETLMAARRILGLVWPDLRPQTVADIGCGTGTWLAVARELGAADLVGIEGDWVTSEMLDDQCIAFHTRDLSKPLDLRPSADLAISLEVGEHLPEERAEGFIEDITSIAPAVLFSAALPGQGGVKHVNERWPSYWAALFAKRGYRAYDLVRPHVWGDRSIPFWYRQNIIVYVSDDHPMPAIGPAVADLARLDIVHPELLARANRELDYAAALPESLYLARARPNR